MECPACGNMLQEMTAGDAAVEFEYVKGMII